MRNSHKAVVVLALAVVTGVLMSDPAMAQGFGKVESTLQKILDVMMGTAAKILAAIAFAISVGKAWFSQQGEIKGPLIVLCAIGVYFSALAIVNSIVA